MNTINKEYGTERNVDKAYFEYCKHSVKKYLYEQQDESKKRLFEAILKRNPECWTLLYALKIRLG